MRRRDFVTSTAAMGIFVAASSVPDVVRQGAKALESTLAASNNAGGNKLTPPAKGSIPVAFAISEGVTVIDFTGPWEVFQDVMVPTRGKDMEDQMPFQLFTVSEKT